MARSIMVVLAGWLAVGLLVVATDGVLHMQFPNDYVTGKVPPASLMLISLATAGQAPHWYSLTLIVAWPVMVYLGGKTQIRRPFSREG